MPLGWQVLFLGAYECMPMVHHYCKCWCFDTCANSSDVRLIPRRWRQLFFEGLFTIYSLDWFHDSHPAIFFNQRFMAARYEEEGYEKDIY